MIFSLNADYVTCLWQVPENIFIQYDSAEEIVRYALSAKLAPLEGKIMFVEVLSGCWYYDALFCMDYEFFSVVFQCGTAALSPQRLTHVLRDGNSVEKIVNVS